MWGRKRARLDSVGPLPISRWVAHQVARALCVSFGKYEGLRKYGDRAGIRTQAY